MRRITLIAGTLALALGLAVQPVAARSGSTIVGTAVATPGFSHLAEAVQRAGLVETLDGRRQFTVFAPTDAAFEELFVALGVSGVDEIPVSTLQAVLLYHVAPGARDSGAVLSSNYVRTMSRQFLVPSVNDGSPWINDARIVAADIWCSNGVIHVIDKVLIPGS